MHKYIDYGSDKLIYEHFIIRPSTNTKKYFGGGAMVLGKLTVPGRPTIWIIVGQGPTVLAEGAGEGGF